MIFMNLKEVIVAILIFIPIVTLIHEIGHAFTAKLFGCKLKRIVIGKGKTILKLGLLEIKSIYFFPGWYETYDIAKTKAGRAMIHIGGSLSNLISASIVILLINNEIVEHH